MPDASTAAPGWRSPGAEDHVAQPAGRGPAVAATVAALALTLVAVHTFVAGTMYGAFSSDFPWLWRTGQRIFEAGALPAGDPFSWTAAGRPWVLYQWLFEAAVAAVQGAVGTGGLVLLFDLLAVGTYVAAPVLGAVPRRVALPWTAIAGAAALAVASVNLSLRPMIATSVLLLLQYVLVQRWRRGAVGPWATAAWLAPAYALWANLHTGIVLGLLSLALMAAGDLLERRGLAPFDPRDATVEGRPQGPGAYAALAAAALAASLANPYGWGIYAYLARLSADARLNAEIVELGSPDFHVPQLAWFLGFVGVLLVLLTRRRRTLAPADLLLLVVFTGATLLAQRFVVWAVLYGALVLPRALHQAWGGRVRALAAGGTARALVAGAAVLAPAAIALLGPAEAPLGRVCAPLLPAIDAYDAARGPADRLLNDPLTGSCMIGHEPAPRVFIDTRFDFYGGAHAAEAMRMLRLEPGWREDLDRWAIDAVVVGRGWPLAQALALDPGFGAVHADEAAVVYRRAPAGP